MMLNVNFVRVGLYKKLLALGYYVLAVDYRGYGDSTVISPVTEASCVTDARAALAWLTAKLGDQVKVVVTLTGDAISGADINLKLCRPHTNKDAYHNTTVREDLPWKLQQVQDAANHLQLAMELLQDQDRPTSREYLRILS